LRTLTLRGRKLVGGLAEGVALVTKQPISFFGGVKPETGLVVERGHELQGKSIRGKVLVFPHGKGSTVGSYTLYALAKQGAAPRAIVNLETEPIIAVGCALTGIPLVDRLNKDPLEVIDTGDYVKILEDGTVEVRKSLA
jgi:hypothetical protein